MIVLGIDPGSSTGMAWFVNGRLDTLATIEPYLLHERIHSVDFVVFEDSRLQSHVWAGAGATRPAMAKIARNVGMIDAWCELIAKTCASRGIAYISISPKAKGAKLDAEAFYKRTGWDARCNQHERDAAMVAWAYRGIRESTNKKMFVKPSSSTVSVV